MSAFIRMLSAACVLTGGALAASPAAMAETSHIKKENTLLKDGFYAPAFAEFSGRYHDSVKVPSLSVRVGVQVIHLGPVSGSLGYGYGDSHLLGSGRKAKNVYYDGPAADLKLSLLDAIALDYGFLYYSGIVKDAETDPLVKSGQEREGAEHRLAVLLTLYPGFEAMLGVSFENKSATAYSSVRDDAGNTTRTRSSAGSVRDTSVIVGVRGTNF